MRLDNHLSPELSASPFTLLLINVAFEKQCLLTQKLKHKTYTADPHRAATNG